MREGSGEGGGGGRVAFCRRPGSLRLSENAPHLNS